MRARARTATRSRTAFAIAIATALATSPAMAAGNATPIAHANDLSRAIQPARKYVFLGALQSWHATTSGATFRCAPGADLRVRFVSPSSFRVTLVRDSTDEDLLTDALVATDWPPVGAQTAEDARRVTLRTDRVTVTVSKAGCRIAVQDPDGSVIGEDDAGMGIGWDADEVRNWKKIEDGDRFFGLGEKTGNLDKRGVEWTMWNSDTYAYGPETDPVYESIPFVLGVRRGRAWGLFFNNSHRSTFNMGAGNHRYWSFAADGGRMDYVFFYGPAVSDVVREYTALTGRAPMPPMWALGYQQSRWSYYPASEVLALARTFRTKNIPADVIYLDIHYMDGYRVFTWDPARFPDPGGMLARLDSMGFKVVTIIDPGVKVDSAWSVSREGLASGHFVKYPDGEVFVGSVWPGRSYFPDFSRQATRDWWAGNLARSRETGVRGFWNDMNEPAVWGKAFPLEVLMDDGGRMSSQKKMHNLYGFLMAKGTYEGLRRLRPDERPFVLTRAGFAGIQRYSAVWTGDNVASSEHLELGIRMLLGMGLSGVPFVGTDVGGFAGTPSPELFARWIQVGAWSPFFRAHTTANTPDQEPWSFGEQVEDIVRDAITNRYRMLPYLYSLFHEAHESGAPILRPLFWHAQDDSMAYDPAWQQQFTVGRDLLVAPVTREGVTLQRVYLPRGRWLEMGTGRVHQGPAVVTVDAPLERTPTFLRAGAIVPMGEPMQYVGEKPGGMLTLQVFEGDQGGTFDLYEDDGATYANENGAFRTTRFTARRTNGALRIAREVTHDGWAPPARSIEVRLLGMQAAPSSVSLGNATLRALTGATASGNGFRWDGAAHVLTVRFDAAGARQEVTIR